MDDDFLTSVEGYSESTQDVMAGIISGDGGFHSNAFASESPFFGMMSQDGDGFIFVDKDVEVSIGGDAVSFQVSLNKSDEEKVWFFKVTFNEDSFSGILRFNTVYNARGSFSFAFINDSDVTEFDDVTKSLPYSTFFAMVK